MTKTVLVAGKCYCCCHTVIVITVAVDEVVLAGYEHSNTMLGCSNAADVNNLFSMPRLVLEILVVLTK